MRVSIVVPCYNEKDTIRKIVDAVRAAPVENIEIIIVDDFSTDGTRDILKGEIAAGEVSTVIYQRAQSRKRRSTPHRISTGDGRHRDHSGRRSGV